MKKKVLFILGSFPPYRGAGSLRGAGLSKYLLRTGWEVHVLSPKGRYYPSNAVNREIIPEEVNIHRTRALYPTFGRESSALVTAAKKATRKGLEHLGIPDRLMGWIPFGYAAARKLLLNDGFDVIYSSSTPFSSHVICYLLKRSLNVPWVSEFRDPWSDNPSFSQNIPKKFLGSLLESKVLKSSDLIVTVNNYLVEDFKRLLGEGSRGSAGFEVLRNGFDPEIRNLGRGNFRFDNGTFHITYTGRFYPDRGSHPDYFLRAVRTLLEEKKIVSDEIMVHFFGGFPQDSRKLIEKQPLSDVVKFHGRVSFLESVRAQEKSDLLLLFTGYKESSKWETTSKVYGYMSAGVPVLALTNEESDVADLIRETRIGEVGVGDNVPGIAEVLMKFVQAYRVGNLDSVYQPDQSRIRQYTYPELAKKLDRLMTRII